MGIKIVNRAAECSTELYVPGQPPTILRCGRGPADHQQHSCYIAEDDLTIYWVEGKLPTLPMV